jgi:hypothetical protein
MFSAKFCGGGGRPGGGTGQERLTRANLPA